MGVILVLLLFINLLDKKTEFPEIGIAHFQFNICLSLIAQRNRAKRLKLGTILRLSFHWALKAKIQANCQ
jgi:hypothetical protein